MSTNLDLLSDSTFGTKMDAQNGILTDIKDGLTGGSNAVTASTPDADSVVQLKKKDPVTGNDVDVYPVLAPVSGLGRYLFPALPSEIDLTDWNAPECFISNNTSNPLQSIITPTNYLKSLTFTFDYNYTSILIRRDIIDPNSSYTATQAIANFILIETFLSQNTYPLYIETRGLYTINGTEYYAYKPVGSWSYLTLIV